MRYLIVLTALLAACAASPRKLAQRAIDATGGAEALGAVHSYHMSSEGVYLGVPYTAVVHYRDPGDWRWDMDSDQMKMNAWVLGEGHQVYMSAGGKAMAEKGRARMDYIMHMLVGNAVLFPNRLLAKDVTLEKADPILIDGVRHPALRARFENSDPVTFAFDPETHRVRRVIFTMLNPEAGKLMPAVLDLSSFTDQEGIQVAGKSHMVMGEGENVMRFDEEVTGVIWNPEISQEVFAVPELQAEVEIAVKEEPETLIAAYTFVGPYEKVGEGIEKTMAWIAKIKATPAGPVALIYKGPPPPDMSQAKTYIQIPVSIETMPPKGEFRILKRKAFPLVYAKYEGPVAGCHLLFGTVDQWCQDNGYRKTGPWRVQYLSFDKETGQCTAEVGYPARK